MTSTQTDVTELRDKIDVAALSRFLARDGRLGDDLQGELDVKQFGFGQSNPTF